MEHSQVLAWGRAVCQSAMESVKESGDARILNQMVAHPALQHFFVNVFSLQAVSEETWVLDYPGYYTALESLFNSYQAQQHQVSEAAALKEQIAALQAQVEGLKTLVASIPTTSASEASEAPDDPEEASDPDEPSEEDDDDLEGDTREVDPEPS